MDRRHFLGGLVGLAVMAALPKWGGEMPGLAIAEEPMTLADFDLGMEIMKASGTRYNDPHFMRNIKRFEQQIDEMARSFKPDGMSDTEWFGYDLRK